MKKTIAFTTAAVLALSMLSACGSSATTATSSSSSSSSTSGSSSVSTSSVSTSSSSESTSTDQYLDDFSALPIVSEYKIADCITLGNYKGLELTDSYADATDDDVDSYISENMAAEEVTDADATLAEGDTANIDFTGSMEGEDMTGGSSSDYDLVIGSNTFIEGFEDGLIGMKKGETRDIDLVFPDDYWDEDYQGKPVTFTVTLNAIKRAPELTDDWVKANTDCTTVDEYKAEVKEQLNESNRETADETLMNDAWNLAGENSTFKAVPEDLMEEMRTNYDDGMEYVFSYYGLTKEEYLEQSDVTEDEYNEYREAYAQNAVENIILTDAIWEKEGLSEDDQGYQDALQKIADEYGSTVDELIEAYGEDSITSTARNNYVMAKLVEWATVK